MLRSLVFFLSAVCVQGATLQGVLLDQETGRPLARGTVILDGLPGTPNAGRAVVRTDVHGVFGFSSLSTGAYLLSASRVGFAALHYGEKGYGKPGLAVLLSGDLLGIEMRMHRLGAISGTVWDENQIGLPDIPVLVYSASRPIKVVAHGLTDDRGAYRVGGLPPGSYLVRNAAHSLEDGSGVTPSFFPDSVSATQARPVEVRIDQTSSDINFQPGFGKMFRISGRLFVPSRQYSAMVDLISDTGRQSTPVDDQGNFSFEGIAAGQYELSSEVHAQYRQHMAAYQILLVDRDLQGLLVPMYPVFPLHAAIGDVAGKAVSSDGVTLFARRKDLDAEGAAVKIVSDKTELPPGNWEFLAQTAPSSYPVSITLGDRAMPAGTRGDSWTAVYLEPSGRPSLRVALSPLPATVSGRVSGSINEAAVGAPVYLETMDLDQSARQEMRIVYTDATGRYTFQGLPPGRYRVASSPDIDISDRNALEAANAKVLSVKDADRINQDLP